MPITRKKPLLCPIEVTLSALSARWKARIIWQLANESSSFGALRSNVGGISDRMLTVQLSELVADGIVDVDPSSREGRYRLSTMGESLLPVLESIKAWGTAMIAHRARSQSAVAVSEDQAPSRALRPQNLSRAVL